MHPFAYRRVATEREAFDAVALEEASFIAGGSDVMQLWKLGVSAPATVVDISALPLRGVAQREGGIAIGALARLADVADHPVVRAEYKAVAEALLASASPQIRNVATIGGNLLQRTRCAYFRSSLPCNKREPGSGCGALRGENRLHALFGTSGHCVAVHASDLAVALVCLDASVRIRSATDERVIALEALYRTPGEDPEHETTLAKGELIVEVEVPRTALARNSHYLKVRDRASFELALVSAAVALEVEDRIIRAARICAGGVGATPWRLRACEAALADAPCGEEAFHCAAALASDGARPLSQNGFKVELLKRVVLRALAEVGGGHDDGR